jgi:hypothetical protein
MIQYIPLSAPDHRSPVQDPGIGLLINDNQPPRIFNCPANVVATARNGHLETVVRWVEPVANDNVKVTSVLSTTPSGSIFPVYNSPHTVTYTATDSSGLTSTCVFNVTVLYEQHTINVTLPVNGPIERTSRTYRLVFLNTATRCFMTSLLKLQLSLL